jgi:hypothetical protein
MSIRRRDAVDRRHDDSFSPIGFVIVIVIHQLDLWKRYSYATKYYRKKEPNCTTLFQPIRSASEPVRAVFISCQRHLSRLSGVTANVGFHRLRYLHWGSVLDAQHACHIRTTSRADVPSPGVAVKPLPESGDLPPKHRPVAISTASGSYECRQL